MRLRSALSIALCLGAACAGPSSTGDHNTETPPTSPKDGPNAAVIQRALEWLKDHQDEDGRWDADGFMRHDTEGDPCDGPGSSVHDVGVTGLALLAYLGDGNTMGSGPFAEQVQRGVEWLVGQQRDDGLIGTAVAHDFIYDHAIATYALCEAYGLSHMAAALEAPAQKAINYLESHRNPGAVWRYQPRDKQNDTSVTVWCLFAYRAARDFGLQVDDQAFEHMATWLDEVTDPANGRIGYTKRGERSSRHPGDHSMRFPPQMCESLTAAGLFGRFMLGQNPRTTPVMSKSADLLVARPPRWDPDAGTIDPYYWMMGSYALFQMGGGSWRTWQPLLISEVAAHQRADGNFAGSWDPIGVWDADGGRVYATALYTLALEVAYRYARLVR